MDLGPFGPEVDGAPHARLMMDANVPDGALLEATVLDAMTGTPVPGFTDLEVTTMDWAPSMPLSTPSCACISNWRRAQKVDRASVPSPWRSYAA